MVLIRICKKIMRIISRIFQSVRESPRAEPTHSINQDIRYQLASNLSGELVDLFIEEPYVVIPKRVGEWYVIAPKFVNLDIGWLERTTKSYNIYILNRYVGWLSGVPKELQERLGIKPPILIRVQDGKVISGKYTEQFWNQYRRYLYRREDKSRIQVRRGYEFRLIAAMIHDGFLPFPIKKVEANLIQKAEVGFTLRKYQRDAWDQFLKYGAIGVYWPFGAGKTFLGLYSIASLKGPKLVIVPTRTLREQWQERIKQYTKATSEVVVETYHSYSKVRDQSFTLVIFDECHRLPADTFSRLSTIKSRFRLGLSATPYREDGRTEYIFALTGFPVGIDWGRLFSLGIVQKPTVTVYLFVTFGEKIAKLKRLIGDRMKTLIFCDSLALGKRLSDELEIPFVSSRTRNRLKTIQKNLVVIVSRVGDEGISLQDVERVIEVDFLFGSRRQEAQRLGRLLHAKARGEHIVLMTDNEFEKYEKRFYSLYEKGFRVNIIR